jgi:hypothetical protein
MMLEPNLALAVNLPDAFRWAISALGIGLLIWIITDMLRFYVWRNKPRDGDEQ